MLKYTKITVWVSFKASNLKKSLTNRSVRIAEEAIKSPSKTQQTTLRVNEARCKAKIKVRPKLFLFNFYSFSRFNPIWSPQKLPMTLLMANVKSFCVKVHIFWEVRRPQNFANLYLLLSTVHTDKSKVDISQNFVAFSEDMNFNIFCLAQQFARLYWTNTRTNPKICLSKD